MIQETHQSISIDYGHEPAFSQAFYTQHPGWDFSNSRLVNSLKGVAISFFCLSQASTNLEIRLALQFSSFSPALLNRYDLMFRSNFLSSLFIQYYCEQLSFAIVYLALFEVIGSWHFMCFYEGLKCIWRLGALSAIQSEIISTD